MFQELLGTVKVNIATIRSLIKTNERLKELAFGGVTLREKFPEHILTPILQDIPRASEWRVYDHCSVVTRLYAIYERFVEDLIKDWLNLLPGLFTRYSDLDERIRNTHLMGVGRLLVELNKNRYEHLSPEEVVRGLFLGVKGEDEYDLLSDAFLFHERNLRKETLEKLFADAGLSNMWTWVDKHQAVRNFVQEIRGNQNTTEGELNELISYRNDAAHGARIDDVLGDKALLELCDFIESLCQALSEFVTSRVIERKKLIGQAREIGKITEWFKKQEAGVAKVDETILLVGNTIFLVSETSYCCQLATIESIQINQIPLQAVQTTNGMEVGLKFDINAKKGLSLYQVNS
ncbi:MAE_28990/MAE_18760 family HEPN-like nuclease [Gloeocapsopsis dulcis]|uniref:RiboL-PSP-HEPN domain-containing protein n=1 Tax=Gloeocapsopsis dulcis AAB1 = 1H9 TaxID=1433147 RepID=A0A6N8FZY9_9CHRO|nr:MAE_28990/MAE_18760 family HEPN-like nuclease [Gloeocapsopsis dulcis]MUL38429.1 hypothetical protein [Gloeocapsopsis dulcis AAB1 = 1H9]WNN89749.1 MAE_28990/MAE_18760 family HEPN-like nuclease [Gloeocapsopsis dulcis]